MKPKTISTFRQSSVSSALASVRVEGLEPSKQLLSELDAYIAGKKPFKKSFKRQKRDMSRYDITDTYCYYNFSVLNLNVLLLPFTKKQGPPKRPRT